jgi:hypothetical protein
MGPKQLLPQKIKPNLEITPADANQTVKRVIFITTELSKKIDEKAKDMFGERKGNVSLYMEQAMRIHLHMNIEGVHER